MSGRRKTKEWLKEAERERKSSGGTVEKREQIVINIKTLKVYFILFQSL